MKNASLTALLLLVFLTCNTLPSVAQVQNQNQNNSSSSTSPMQFMAPNYWGDARVKNRSTATNNSQASSAPPMSGGRSGGGGGMSPLMFMGPAMMLPAMMRTATGRGVHRNHKNRQYEEDEKPSKRKKGKKVAQQPSVNDENNMPDPLVPMSSALSKKTFDLQNGNGMPLTEEQRMRVTGVMQDEEVSAQMRVPGQTPNLEPLQPEQFQVQTPIQQQAGAPVQAQMPAAGTDLQNNGVDF